jgi:small subunit ribosomal protein S6
MPFYETVFMARQDLTEAQVRDMTEKYCALVKNQGGKIHKTENWGLRTLAYRIKKNKKAHYVLIESDAPAAAVIELERNLRLDEDVLRSLTVREDKLSEGPSAMMEKPGRYDGAGDDRPERSDKDKREAA